MDLARCYQRNNLGQKDQVTVFWDFSDVTVPIKYVNDMILALNDDSTKKQIKAARESLCDALKRNSQGNL